jgi:hypothetical protein
LIQEMGEDGLSGIHPSWSAIATPCGHSALALASAAVNSNLKQESFSLSLVICDGYNGRPDFGRALLSSISTSKSRSLGPD